MSLPPNYTGSESLLAGGQGAAPPIMEMRGGGDRGGGIRWANNSGKALEAVRYFKSTEPVGAFESNEAEYISLGDVIGPLPPGIKDGLKRSMRKYIMEIDGEYYIRRIDREATNEFNANDEDVLENFVDVYNDIKDEEEGETVNPISGNDENIRTLKPKLVQSILDMVKLQITTLKEHGAMPMTDLHMTGGNIDNYIGPLPKDLRAKVVDEQEKKGIKDTDKYFSVFSGNDYIIKVADGARSQNVSGQAELQKLVNDYNEVTGRSQVIKRANIREKIKIQIALHINALKTFGSVKPSLKEEPATTDDSTSNTTKQLGIALLESSLETYCNSLADFLEMLPRMNNPKDIEAKYLSILEELKNLESIKVKDLPKEIAESIAAKYKDCNEWGKKLESIVNSRIEEIQKKMPPTLPIPHTIKTDWVRVDSGAGGKCFFSSIYYAAKYHTIPKVFNDFLDAFNIKAADATDVDSFNRAIRASLVAILKALKPANKLYQIIADNLTIFRADTAGFQDLKKEFVDYAKFPDSATFSKYTPEQWISLLSDYIASENSWFNAAYLGIMQYLLFQRLVNIKIFNDNFLVGKAPSGLPQAIKSLGKIAPPYNGADKSSKTVAFLNLLYESDSRHYQPIIRKDMLKEALTMPPFKDANKTEFTLLAWMNAYLDTTFPEKKVEIAAIKDTLSKWADTIDEAVKRFTEEVNKLKSSGPPPAAFNKEKAIADIKTVFGSIAKFLTALPTFKTVDDVNKNYTPIEQQIKTITTALGSETLPNDLHTTFASVVQLLKAIIEKKRPNPAADTKGEEEKLKAMLGEQDKKEAQKRVETFFESLTDALFALPTDPAELNAKVKALSEEADTIANTFKDLPKPYNTGLPAIVSLLKAMTDPAADKKGQLGLLEKELQKYGFFVGRIPEEEDGLFEQLGGVDSLLTKIKGGPISKENLDAIRKDMESIVKQLDAVDPSKTGLRTSAELRSLFTTMKAKFEALKAEVTAVEAAPEEEEATPEEAAAEEIDEYSNAAIRGRLAAETKAKFAQALNIYGDKFDLNSSIEYQYSHKPLKRFLADYGIGPDYQEHTDAIIRAFFTVFPNPSSGEAVGPAAEVHKLPEFHVICAFLQYRILTLRFEIQLTMRSTERRTALEHIVKKLQNLLKGGKCGSINTALAIETMASKEQYEKAAADAKTAPGAKLATMDGKLNKILADLTACCEKLSESLKPGGTFSAGMVGDIQKIIDGLKAATGTPAPAPAP